MKSRLVTRLEEEARSSDDPISWARSICRAASHFARQGLTGEATAAIASVRNTFGNQMEPEVAAWLMLAEGIIHFAAGDHAAAKDRIRRADGLAVALAATRARATCAAWLAHIDFNLGLFDSMSSCLDRAFLEANSDDHQALGRASLVVADAYHYAGSFSLARPWYDAARQHATAEGDETMLSAVLHNVAAFRAVNVLLGHALGKCLPEEAHRVKMEATTAAGYDRAVGTRSFESLTDLLAGQLHLVDGDAQSALDRLSKVQSSALPPRLWPVLYADLGWCASALGQHDKALSHLKKALEVAQVEMAHDDAAYAWARLSDVHKARGDAEASREMAQRAAIEMERLRVDRMELLQRLNACEFAASKPR